jgi:hypothetical protein
MPDLVPFRKKRSMPLWRKLLITYQVYRVTIHVSNRLVHAGDVADRYPADLYSFYGSERPHTIRAVAPSSPSPSRNGSSVGQIQPPKWIQAGSSDRVSGHHCSA